jgi:hypothetical protein
VDERSLWAGLLFFFVIDEAVRAATSRLEGPAPVATHPGAPERTERLVTAFPPRHDTALTLVHAFGAWSEHYLPGAVAHIEEVNRTITRRDEPWWRVGGRLRPGRGERAGGHADCGGRLVVTGRAAAMAAEVAASATSWARGSGGGGGLGDVRGGLVGAGGGGGGGLGDVLGGLLGGGKH